MLIEKLLCKSGFKLAILKMALPMFFCKEIQPRSTENQNVNEIKSKDTKLHKACLVFFKQRSLKYFQAGSCEGAACGFSLSVTLIAVLFLLFKYKSSFTPHCVCDESCVFNHFTIVASWTTFFFLLFSSKCTIHISMLTTQSHLRCKLQITVENSNRQPRTDSLHKYIYIMQAYVCIYIQIQIQIHTNT